MDANGLRCWMLADKALPRAAGERPRFRPDWLVDDVRSSQAVEYDQRKRCLRLVSRRSVDHAADRAAAEAQFARPPRALDRFGNWATWVPVGTAGGGELRANGAFPGSTSVPVLSIARPHDFFAGPDERLYVTQGTTIRVGRLADLRNLYETSEPWPVSILDTRTDAAASLRGLEPQRLAPRLGGGAWILERTSGRVALLEVGEEPPLPPAHPVERFRARGAPPLRCVPVANPLLGPGEQAIALATAPDGALGLLTWDPQGASRLRVLGADRTWSAPSTLDGVPFAHSLGWMDEERAAVLVAGVTEAIVYPWRAGQRLIPIGDRFPLRQHDGAPFLRGASFPPAYWSRSPEEAAESGDEAGRPRLLRALSLPSYARKGRASHLRRTTHEGHTKYEGRKLDSGDIETVWHRLYLEAVVPAGTGLRIDLTTDEAGDEDACEWHPHVLGDVPDVRAHEPRAAPLSAPSEIPFHRGLLACEERGEHAGCFTVLVQRGAKRTRALRGRRLQVRVTLFGDGRTTPELYALRVYGSRFSYVEHYLPELYRETLFGPEADEGKAEEPARSTPADFLERFVDNFEGVLTPIEDRIAAAHHVTTPAGVPADALGWLAGWLGVPVEGAWDEPVVRSVLAHAAELGAWHGTRRGLELLTDLVLPRSVTGGRVVFLEEWQLRRTFATILGADLADEEDPLVGALSVSGNSIVGDTLVLGGEERAELLALYSADVPASAAEAEAVRDFFDEHANRLLAVVSRDLSSRELGLLQRVLALEVPAHVRARIAPVTQRLLVGLSSLVGVDTRLDAEPPPRTARASASTVGRGDRVARPPSLDPRLQGDIE